ncbi:MAG: pitrilysin family protein [Candidatus Eisenbacteria bacterium]
MMLGFPRRRGGLEAAAALALAVSCATLAAAPAHAQDSPETPSASVAALVTPEEGRLKNGLRVLSLVDPHAAVSTFQVWYDTGSRNERSGITGISHLFEHLMFKGTKKVGPEEHGRQIQAVGGINNAATSWDVTYYWQALPPDQLELAARLEADRMANLALTDANLLSEREVVKEERRFRVDNQPIGRAVELLTALAYDSNPYHWPTLGWPGDLDAITLDDCKDYYAIHYAPDKAVVIIAGPTTHADNMKLVERYFGGLKPGRPAPRVAVGEMPQHGAREATLEAEVQLPILLGGYKVPPDSSADSPVIEVIANLLSTGESSRLYRKLVYDDQSALFAGGLALGRKDVGLFYAFCAARPGRDRDSLETSFFHEFERLATDDVSPEELSRVQNQLEAQFVFGLEQVQDRATNVGIAALIGGDPKRASDRVARWRAVTTSDIRRVAATYLVPANRTRVWVMPAPRRAS